MLAAWFRFKFPNIIDGVIASSAPILQFGNRKNLDLELFFNYSTIVILIILNGIKIQFFSSFHNLFYN